MLPTWAVVSIVGIVTGVGGFIVKYLMSSSRTLGRLEQAFTDRDRRLSVIEHWMKDRDAELVAYRNGYRERPRWALR